MTGKKIIEKERTGAERVAREEEKEKKEED